jgi:hypothetical protein
MQRRIVTAVAILLCEAALRAADGPTKLPAIPDVGEPFDVKSFITVPFSYRRQERGSSSFFRAMKFQRKSCVPFVPPPLFRP